MSTKKRTEGLESDEPLYNNDQEYLNLAKEMKSPPSDEEYETDLRNLLQHVRIIMGMPQPKVEEEAPKIMTFSNSGLTGLIRPYANSICKQIGNKEIEKSATLAEEAKAILAQHKDIPLTTQGILALAAFATMYGKFRLLKQQVAHGSSQLAKSIALLRQQSDTLAGGPNPNDDEFTKRSKSINDIFEPTLDLADQVLDHMKLSQIKKSETNTLVHFTAILRIVSTVVLCYSHVETVLIKHSREMIWDIGRLRINLDKKSRAIKRLLSKDSVYQLPPIDEAPRSVPQRSASFNNCWMMLGNLINTTSTIKSQKQIKSFTRTNSLPDTHLMFSEDVEGALLNKDPAYKEAM